MCWATSQISSGTTPIFLARLKRTLALLYETLRIYSPVPIAKSTGNSEKVLTVEGKTLVAPANTLLTPNHIALHTHPKFWGSDSLKFNLARWIDSSSGPFKDEVIHYSTQGLFHSTVQRCA